MAKQAQPEQKYLFAAIPPRAFKDGRLGASHWRLLAAVSFYDRFGKNATGCYASQSTLARETGLSRETVNRSLRSLDSWGYIKSERSASGKRRVQYFVIHESKQGAPVTGQSQELVTNRSHDTPETCDELVNPETGEIIQKLTRISGLSEGAVYGIYSAKQGNTSSKGVEGYSPEGTSMPEIDVNPQGRISVIEQQFRNSFHHPQQTTKQLNAAWEHWCSQLCEVMDRHRDDIEASSHAERVLIEIEEALADLVR